MQDTYQKIAKGIKILGEEIKPNDIVIPIGLDGAILYHLLISQYEFSTDFLKNTCDISSKTYTDTTKFKNLLNENNEKTIYVLDMRTVTGNLGNKLKHVAGVIPFNYIVLFDVNHYANICIFDGELSDKERIIWLSKEEYKQLDIENITHNYIKEISAVKEIKKYLD